MSHEFALYSPEVTPVFRDKSLGSSVVFADEQLWHRLKHVLRAAPGYSLCLFDRTTVVQVTLSDLTTKNQIRCTLDLVVQPRALAPKIIVVLPLLKREAFSEALYACVELGAHEVRLVTTRKSQHAWSGARDRERCEKIMIAAAEQSKQFVMPALIDPVPLVDAIMDLPSASMRIHCDPQGQSLWQVINQVRIQQPEAVVVSIGPEGDLTDQEREQLYKQQFMPCALTPTVLRAQQALQVALGAFRACL